MTTHQIPLDDILSITGDRLLSRRHMDGIYETLRLMTGQDVFTHQLVQVADAVKPVLIQQHPFLADLQPPDDLDVPDLMAWLVETERQHGETLEVTPIDGWVYRDPIEDACDSFGADGVFVVPAPGGEAR